MLAYVFWHTPRPGTPRAAYEDALQAFHASLRASPPAGFHGSFILRTPAVAWFPAASGGDVYEDWYLLADSAALDRLDEAAVHAVRRAVHDAPARLAAAGTAGLYQLRHGDALGQTPTRAHWFSKPAGQGYDAFFAELLPAIPPGGRLWQRRMTFGPATEFCLHVSDGAPVLPQVGPGYAMAGVGVAG